MKTTLLLLWIVLVPTISLAQIFEGKIMYATSCKSKNPKVTDQQYTAMIGTTMEYYIRGGNYKSVTNGFMLKWQLFTNKDHKLYTRLTSSEAILWRDASINKDEVLKVELHKNALTILGYSCHEIVLTCKNGTQKYYFNSELAVDPAVFAKHQYGNWAAYLVKSKALPLKSIVELDQFFIESVATEVKPMKLDNSTFELPQNATFKESYL